ncbi:MAG: alpha/beta fold hydrolase [Nocardioides sp.]|nr:alpha/beta fold hydrolase [Nocardioides sp.]
MRRRPGPAEMHVVHDGPRDAPPLLLIHGSGASGASWGPVIPALAARRHVIRVDLPGCGQSPPPPSYDVPAQAERVADVLDTLGLRRLTVVGHSSGGYVATALAEQRADLVSSLALISTGPSMDAFLGDSIILRAILTPPLGPLVWRIRSDSMIRRSIASTCARPVEVPDDAVADLMRTTYGSMRAVLRHNEAYIVERSVPDRLAGLNLRLLVLFGVADPRWDSASAHQYDAVPDARVELLPDVGHVPMLEAPEAIATLLVNFTAPERSHARRKTSR